MRYYNYPGDYLKYVGGCAQVMRKCYAIFNMGFDHHRAWSLQWAFNQSQRIPETTMLNHSFTMEGLFCFLDVWGSVPNQYGSGSEHGFCLLHPV